MMSRELGPLQIIINVNDLYIHVETMVCCTSNIKISASVFNKEEHSRL